MVRIQSHETLVSQLALAESLLLGRDQMREPQNLPGRFGRVINSVDRVLAAIGCEAVVGGGWAVWRHGFVGRVTQDVDIVLPATRIEEFLKVAAFSGFQVLEQHPGRWPKLMHRESDVQVDILPEGERPGFAPDFAPTTIPSPTELGAEGTKLRYMSLRGLVELKLAAGRLKDHADVIELIRSNDACIDEIRMHLEKVDQRYHAAFDHLLQQSKQDESR